MPYFANFKLAKSSSRHSCSLVRDFQKWFQNENIFKIGLAPKVQSFLKSLKKAENSKSKKCAKIDFLLCKSTLLSNILNICAFYSKIVDVYLVTVLRKFVSNAQA